MEGQPLPQTIREVAGQDGYLTASDREGYLRYVAAKQVLINDGQCLSPNNQDNCVSCHNDEPNDRLCVRAEAAITRINSNIQGGS